MEAHDGSSPVISEPVRGLGTLWHFFFIFCPLSFFLSFFLLNLLTPDSTHLSDSLSPSPPSLSLSVHSIMASPRLETFCCPNRDAATDFVVSFQPTLFGVLTLSSAALSFVFAILQILPKRKGFRRLGQFPLTRPASSVRILFIISLCDILGCAGKSARSNYAHQLRKYVILNF